MTAISERELLAALGLGPAPDVLQRCLIEYFESIGFRDTVQVLVDCFPDGVSGCDPYDQY